MKTRAAAWILAVLVSASALGVAGQLLLPPPAALLPLPVPGEAVPGLVVVESASDPEPERPAEGPSSPSIPTSGGFPPGDADEVAPAPDEPEPNDLAVVLTGRDGYVDDGRVTLALGPELRQLDTVIERQLAPLLGGECQAFGPWVATTAQATLPPGTCALYRVLVEGVVVFATSEPVRYDGSAPELDALEVVEESPREFVSGSTLYVDAGLEQLRAVTVAARVDDPESGLASVSFKSETESVEVAEAPWTATITPAPGTIVATATNRAQDTATASVAVVVDGEVPSGGSIAYPARAAGGKSIEILADPGEDRGAGIDETSVAVERRVAPRPATGCGSFGPWTPAGLVEVALEGTCAQYRLRVRDNVGNEAVVGSDTVLEVPDTTPPRTAIVSPEAGALVSGPTTVSATAEDLGAGVATVTIQVARGADGHWTDLGTTTAAPHTATWDIWAFEPGSYVLRSFAEDRAGLTAASEPVQVVVAEDLTPPTSAILALGAGATVSGAVTVSAQAEDSESGVAILRIEVRSAGRCWSMLAEFRSASGSAVWDTASLRPGRYELRAVAVDRRGNSAASEPIEVRVESVEEPEPEPEAPGDPDPTEEEPPDEEPTPPETPEEPESPPEPDDPDHPDEEPEPEEPVEEHEPQPDSDETDSEAVEDSAEAEADAD